MDSRGLSDKEAADRLRSEGPNELPRQRRRNLLRIAFDVLREPMLALLVAGGIIYLLLGDLGEALILLAFACLSVLITVIQESRTERVLEALRDLTSPRALVIRGGAQKRVAGREVVRGDVILLAEGDRVPADAAVLSCRDLLVDESLLTGESVPVRKTARYGAEHLPMRPGGDDLPIVYSGSLVVRGTGTAEVVRTGVRTEIGKIGGSLAALEAEAPRLQRQTRRIVLFFAAAGTAVSALVVLLFGLLRGGWLEALLAGIAIGMSMLPEEFPVVLTLFMTMGAWRISRARVLTRRAAAIEALGSATVLCTDKTGTLTQNRMTVTEIWVPSGLTLPVAETGEGILPAEAADVAWHALLASAEDPFDPMEKAFHALRSRLPQPEANPGATVVRAYGLRPDLLAMTHIWNIGPAETPFVIATKGSPEAVSALCRLSHAERESVSLAVDAMAARGLRVLGVARGLAADPIWPDAQMELPLEFAGLVGLQDPLRPGVPEAVAECRRAGIRVKMITGDYPVTAAAIAREAGLQAREITSGEELERLDDDRLSQRLEEADVFARIMPEQKLRVVEALKAEGEVVAMTGDGVNDAPSLKSAHIGIAMGGRGTDVAREASAIVLLDDDFGSIVKAIRLGRRIYDNLRKAIGFIFAVHIPIAGLAIMPLLFGLPIILAPIHIAFLEMVIDPVCTLVFEAEEEEKDIMNRPPRSPHERLFSPRLVGWSITQGVVAFVAVALVLWQAVSTGMPDDELRALVFFSLVVVIVALIFVNRSFSSSLVTALTRLKLPMVVVLSAVTLALALSILWPVGQSIFRFGPLHLDDLGLTVIAGVSVLVLLELVKPLWREKTLPPSMAQ
jgi:Ca2+-transporting ATPase